MELPVKYEKISFQERRLVREEYIRLQDGLCHYCKAPLSGQPTKDVLAKHIVKTIFPYSFFKWPVHLHHDHKTGMTIGAVHNYCNAVLWQYHGE